MVEINVVWMPSAKIELGSTMAYYKQRNGSPSYNQRIRGAINRVIKRIKDQPLSYQLGEDGQTRIAPVLKFQLLYRIYPGRIEIWSFWDPKQDPDKRFDRR